MATSITQKPPSSGGKGRMSEWSGEGFTVEDACFAHLQLEGNHSVTLETAFALHTEKQKNLSIEIFGEKAALFSRP